MIFSLEVKSFNVSEGPTAIQDGIFEPGQEIVISDIFVSNSVCYNNIR
jgi:hypothetical protein